MCIKLAIVDDDVLIREGLRIILGASKEIEVQGVFNNGQELITHLENNILDVALLDMRMPILNGVDTIREIKRRGYKTKIIVLTTFDEDEYIVKSIKNGANGYLLKSNPPDKIIETIRMVHDGISVIQDDILDKFKVKITETSEGNIDRELFTDREIDIIKEISKGLNNREIGVKLFISEGTVKNHITAILSKTGLKHRTQIAIYYLKGKIYDLSQG